MKNDINAIVKTLEINNELYTNQGQSNLSDDEYDALIKLLRSLDPDNVFLKRIGAKPIQSNTIKHLSLMPSLSDYWNVSELTQSFKKMNDNRDFLPEFKYDGIAVSVIYKKSVLASVATRGDGHTGENITDRTVLIKGIPTTLEVENIPDVIEVRGEVILPYKAFNAVKDTLGYVNPRNSVAGIIRRLDVGTMTGIGLCFMPYEAPIFFPECVNYLEVIDKLTELKIGNFSNPEFTDAFNFIRGLQKDYLSSCTLEYVTNCVLEERSNLPFEIDGVVFKAHNLNKRKLLGFSERTPNWAFAFKFPGSSGITTLLDVEHQVSRNGILTPVGKVQKVFIGGVFYTSTTLHNYEEIKRLQVNIGDKIRIERKGDVIPKITNVVESLNGTVIKPPSYCPCCNSVIVNIDKDYYCSAIDCSEKLALQLAHFASRNAANIEGLAESTARKLVKTLQVRLPYQLYTFTVSELMQLEGFAEDSVNNLLVAIEKSKNVTLPKLLYGLGIEGLGEVSAKRLSKVIRTFDKLLTLKPGDLDSVPLSEIDTTARNGIMNYITNARFQINVNMLILAGINPKDETVLVSNKLKKQSWAITGSFDTMSRNDIKKLIESNGGKYSNSVSSLTTGLIAGTGGGDKLQLAMKNDVTIYTLDKFIKLQL